MMRDALRIAWLLLPLAFFLSTLALAGEGGEAATQPSPAPQGSAADFLHPSILGLTADEKTLHEMATRYGVQYYRVEPKGSDLPYAVNHSAATYLIDPEGTLRFIFPHNTPASVLVEASEYVLAQFANTTVK